MTEAFQHIVGHQEKWARLRGIRFDERGYTLQLEDNLFMPLSEQTRSEFADSKGNELPRENEPGKMQALHSSSALVCNVFEYWRDQEKAPIASVCGVPGMSGLRFEQTYPTGLRGTSPHVDIEFSRPGERPLAIESKFAEPYSDRAVGSFRESYFSSPGLWIGLPKCEALARKIFKKEVRFERFAAAQALKHILGLKQTQPLGFALLYLWYEVISPEAEEHRAEITRFREYVGDEADFREMTYQSFFEALKKSASADRAYLAYLAERYFS